MEKLERNMVFEFTYNGERKLAAVIDELSARTKGICTVITWLCYMYGELFTWEEEVSYNDELTVYRSERGRTISHLSIPDLDDMIEDVDRKQKGLPSKEQTEYWMTIEWVTM